MVDLSLETQTLQLLNDDPAHIYGLIYNPRTRKFGTVVFNRQSDDDAQTGLCVGTMRPFSAGDTPAMACKDALTLRFAK